MTETIEEYKDILLYSSTIEGVLETVSEFKVGGHDFFYLGPEERILAGLNIRTAEGIEYPTLFVNPYEIAVADAINHKVKLVEKIFQLPFGNKNDRNLVQVLTDLETGAEYKHNGGNNDLADFLTFRRIHPFQLYPRRC